MFGVLCFFTLLRADRAPLEESNLIRLTTPVLCLALAACSSYQPLPLTEPGAPTLAHVEVDARALALPVLQAHRFDPSDGLDIVEVAMLAVANNGDLKLARDDAAVAHAQAFAAGLLPDPQLALSRDLSDSGGTDTTRAFSLGLSYDINALLLHASSHNAAEADARKTDLNLLWQEWQVMSQAQLLFVRLQQGQKTMRVLEDTRTLFADRLRRTQAALDRGLLSSDAVTPNMAALQDIERQIFDLKRLANQNAHDLNNLLGLAPETELHLQASGYPAPLGDAQADAALAALPQRRPDLMALQAGYGAEDQRYRGALLAQFPALNVGLTRGRDSSGIYSNAVGINLSLPFLNRNRGNVAIEQATRQKLYDEYQLRVQASRSEVHRILAEQALNLEQQAQNERAEAELSAALAHSETAYRASDVDALVYANARAALLAKQVERIALQQALLEQRIGLQALLGLGLYAPSESANQ